MKYLFSMAVLFLLLATAPAWAVEGGGDEEGKKKKAKEDLLKAALTEYKDYKPFSTDREMVRNRIRIVEETGRWEFLPVAIFLHGVAERDESPRVKVAAFSALAEIFGGREIPKDYEELLEAMLHLGQNLYTELEPLDLEPNAVKNRVNLARAVQTIALPGAERLLASMLSKDRSVSVKAEAVQGLGRRLSFPEVHKTFEKVLKATLAQELVRYKQCKPRNADPVWVEQRVKLVDAVGRLHYPPSVGLLAIVLHEDRTLRIKVAAVVALGRVGTKKACQIAVGAATAEKREPLLVDALPWGLRFVTDEKTISWLGRAGLRHRNQGVRRGVAQALGLMPDASAAIEGILKALKERDVTVLYELVRALGRTKDPRAKEQLLGFADKKDWRLREAAAVSLGSFTEKDAYEKLLILLSDLDWRVAESAVFSLRTLDRKDCVPSLILALKGAHLRVAEEIRLTLEKLTGRDFGFDPDLWSTWWKLRGKKDAKLKPAREVSEVVTYHGIRVVSDRVVFVVDVSGSMEAVDLSGRSRMDYAREELLRTLDGLGGVTLFNIVTFSGDPSFFAEKMQKATLENKQKAKDWVAIQEPSGQTNTFDTLRKIFSDIKGVDTIFFLSDGIPTTGRHLLQEKILAEVAKMNRFRKVRIHCIALLVGKYGAQGAPIEDKERLEDFMRRLASENSGKLIVKK
jgi:HEAT repeat protein